MVSRMSRGKAARLLCIAVILAFISCIGAFIVQGSAGKVEVTQIKVPTDGGRWVSAQLYKPDSATKDNPAPMVVMCHGYLNNNQMLDSLAIELSRRGVSVINMDAYYHGLSSGTDVDVISSCMADGTGMMPMVEYAYNELDYVDKARIGVFGHSMGGMNVWMTCINYGAQYYAALAAAADTNSDGGAEITENELLAAQQSSKVCAGLASGFVALSNNEMCSMLHCNFGINYSYYDEGGADLPNNGDISGESPVSLALINSIFPEEEKQTSAEIGRYYGRAEDSNLRVVFNPKLTHETQHFSFTATAQDVDFFMKAFGMESSLSPNNQVWLVKALFNALGLVACLMAIVPIGVLLLESRAFASLKGDIPAALPALDSKRRKAFFWGGWAASWIISWLTFMPLTGLDTKIFPATAGMAPAAAFPQQVQNFIMIWAVFNGIVGIVLFALSYKLFGKKDGVTPEMWGIKTTFKELVRTIALALCIFALFYVFIFAAQYFFNTDYRFYTIAFCTFTPDKLLVALEYVPFFFIFFAANAIMTNSLYRVEGQREGLNVFLCGLGNILGVFIVNAIQYIKLFSSGAAMYAAGRLYPMAALPLLVLLFAAAYVNRGLFKATGKVWLGAFVNTFIIVMVSVANSATLSVI